jgi:hypothetical protein
MARKIMRRKRKPRPVPNKKAAAKGGRKSKRRR